MHPNLSSYIPIPPAPDTEGFYRGSLLPPPLQRAQSGHATLVFRATLLLSESLHHTDAMLQRNFPGMSHSQIQELDDWMTRVPIPTAHEDIAAAQRGSSPGMVALALLADPLRMYRRAILANPELSVPDLSRVATNDKIAKLFTWRNTVFHVPDTRVRNPRRLENQLMDTAPHEYYRDLISGLWRFFLRGNGINGGLAERRQSVTHRRDA